MRGERKVKEPANDLLGRINEGALQVIVGGSRQGSRGKAASGRSSVGGPKGHKRRKGRGTVIPLPRRRRSERPSSPGRRRRSARRAVGRGRLRLVVGVVVVVCLSLGARAAQLSADDDERYQAFTAERSAATAEDSPERGSITSADGQRIPTRPETPQGV